MNEDERSCPECAETIKKAARVCKHCGYRIATESEPETVPPPIEEMGTAAADQPAQDIHPTPGESIPKNEQASWTDRTLEGGKQDLWGCGFVLAAAVGLLIFLVSNCSASNQEEKAQEAIEAAEAAKTAAAERVENKRRGFHCLSGWNGSHPDVVAAVKRALRNPDSFEHDETVITPADNKGAHHLMMKYRAENGFGGMNMGLVEATISHQTCHASKIKMIRG